ncbi:hypothetical protein ACHAWU_002822 [Discostella pseudostelligera]|uniref:RNA helicase n=1 Tax=Discostella pseudostelligera TaxID=259834 RepID=A0ABD3M2J6_9STRA
MAALLPTILSDDEDEDLNNDSRVGSGGNRLVKKDGGGKMKSSTSSSKKGNASKETKQKVTTDRDNDESEEEEDDDEMDQDFEFGGLLGEDGISFDALSSTLDGTTGSDKNAWSYKSALALLSSNDNAGVGAVVERTSVASIIAAARSNLRRGRGEEDDGGDKDEEKEKDGSQSSSSDSNEDDDESDDDGSSGSGSDSSDDEVDDADKAEHSMESDVLKVQERPQRKKKGKKEASAPVVESQNEEEDDGDVGNDESDQDDDSEEDDELERDDDSEDERKEASKAAAFFDSSHITTTQDSTIDTFSQLGLSRPLLRGVASMGFVSPTPIQASVIPVALAGRDVCASAVTGSGKTAAFLLPIMERILQRGGGRATLGGPNAKKKQSSLAATRALVLAPTRELAAQCVSMMMAMAKFTELRAALIVGGAKNVMSQAAELRTRPDVVVATPGRLLDHITNSQGVDMDDVEFLVLDEADRLLDLGFQDEVHEIIKSVPTERQTMLFSATMSTKVDDLIKLSLKRPVRISATDKKKVGQSTSDNGVEVAPRLEQEFVRIRAGNEGVSREGMLLALLTRTFKTRTIVFFDTKSDAHRLMIVCGLCGIKCAELHGNLTQVQRLEALEAFREGSVDVLLCTDLAARGLDISGVEAVINFEMPSQVSTYVHRIGRTARAGRGGKSCTLIGEGRRYLMKEVIKDADEKNRKQKQEGGAQPMGVIRSRTIPSAVVAHFVAKINSLEEHVKEVMDAETVARLDRIAEMEAVRAQNIIEHSQSIKQRPQKEWFATPKQKMSVKEATAERKRMIEEKVGTGTHRMTRKKRRAQEARAMFQEAREEAAEKEEETGKKSKKAFTEGQIKGSARASKKQEAQREKDRAARSINDDDLRKERKRKQKQKSTNTDAAGDGGLFAEEWDTFAKKPRKESADAPEKSSYFFKEYDPNKKMGKKKAHHGFKSKSKYKRR